MNKNSALRVMVMEGMAMVRKFLHLSSNAYAKTLSLFFPMLPCSFLPCGISVREKVFVCGCHCGIPHVDVKTILYQ